MSEEELGACLTEQVESGDTGHETRGVLGPCRCWGERENHDCFFSETAVYMHRV